MSIPALLEAALSVLAVMILFTLLATAINEAIADNLRNLRGKTLAQVIHNLLDRERTRGTDGPAGTGTNVPAGTGLLDAFYDLPEIRALMRPRHRWLGGGAGFGSGTRRPSAIEPRRVALSVMKVLLDPNEMADLEARASKERDAYRALLEKSLSTLPIGELNQRLALRKVADLSALIDHEMQEFRSTLDDHRARIEADYAELLARAQGWYLRSTRKMLFAIGLVLAIGANIDLLGYAERLMTEDSLGTRAEIAQAMVAGLQATQQAGAAPATDLSALRTEYDSLLASLGALDVHLGWTCQSAPESTALIPISHHVCEDAEGYAWPSVPQAIGWVLIAFGVTLGAQFWFDLFRKLVDLRTAGRTVTPGPGA